MTSFEHEGIRLEIGTIEEILEKHVEDETLRFWLQAIIRIEKIQAMKRKVLLDLMAAFRAADLTALCLREALADLLVQFGAEPDVVLKAMAPIVGVMAQIDENLREENKQ